MLYGTLNAYCLANDESERYVIPQNNQRHQRHQDYVHRSCTLNAYCLAHGESERYAML